MLAYNEIKPKTIILLDGEPYEVLASNVLRKQQRRPVNQTKLRNLKTGKVTERSFQQSETIDEADITRCPARYLYNRPARGGQAPEWWFADPTNPKDRFQILEDVLGSAKQFLKENADVETIVFNDTIIGIALPIKMAFEVKEAPPNVRGNTAQGGTKQVVLETGATVTVPMFIETGDTIEVNTETGEYTQRVST